MRRLIIFAFLFSLCSCLARGQAASGLPSLANTIPFVCSDTSGSATAQSCSTTPSFTLTTGYCFAYNTTTQNSGALTINPNSAGAKTVQKWLGTALASADMPANKTVVLCYDGTNLQLMTIGNAPAGGGGTVTTTGSPANGQLTKFSGATSITTATAHDAANALVCADTSGSGTAQSCSTSPTYTPAAGDWIIYTTTTANTGTGLTLNVNSLGAKSVAKWQGTTTLAANDVLANKYVLATYDGTNWELTVIGNAPSGGGGSNGPLFKQFSTSGGVSSGSASSATTGAQTYAANDLVVCYTRSNTAGRTFTFSSSPSNTWNTTAVQSNGQSGQLGWSVVGAGSTTVTSTFSASDTFGGIICMDYSGMAGTKNTDVEATGSTGALLISPVSTTQRTLNITCASFASTNIAWTTGFHGGIGTSLRATDTGTAGSSPPPTTGGTLACFDANNAWASTNMIFSDTSGTAVQWVGTAVAFNW